ncbi:MULTISPECIES: isoaspartyl peptidase/L-asparaginase [Halorubrum]|uniref:Plant-type L-asparaginase n=1 Tax=Halorubrum sodomense TaxID=35743 RepID=A0A1I6FKZ9_HALSD|nr:MULTISPECIES: isoaspartyl peptidase/L-asparaginase [Halorubrum]TKX56168.1 asparaginase [Halorubrum sp. SP3]TKX67355.1 asparaginase [Halorubrum sp. SP9]SFR30619.1 beta-aspartyl-peptidase (threonine type) [Halorubrum sodomense]
MRVIVHGGAGGTPDDPEPRQAVLDEAAARGADAVTPLDAVESAVGVLEADPRFNAGVGGAIQSDGAVRTDAGVMTSDREIGAACSMPGVERAASVARVVHTETPHIFVSGGHAVDLADEFGVETGVDLLTDETRERYEAEDPPRGGPREHLGWLASRFGSGDDQAGGGSEDGAKGDAPDHDTVGAVATDGEAFAAVTSTGGRSFALAGRVGDVPQVGSGFFCTEAGGASATGAGEDIARVTLSRRAVDHLDDGLDAQQAADRAIEEFEEITGSGAGVIVLGDEGAGSAFNTEGMQTSVADT